MKKQHLWPAVAGAVLAAAAGIFYYNRRRRQQGEKPPRKAPQLRIQNPGDQSEFRTAPSESGIG